MADIRQPPVEYYPEANFRRSRCFQSKLQDALESDSQEGPPQEFRAYQRRRLDDHACGNQEGYPKKEESDSN